MYRFFWGPVYLVGRLGSRKSMLLKLISKVCHHSLLIDSYCYSFHGLVMMSQDSQRMVSTFPNLIHLLGITQVFCTFKLCKLHHNYLHRAT